MQLPEQACARRRVRAQADAAPVQAAAASPQATVRQRAQRVLQLLGVDAGGAGRARGAAPPAPAPDLAGGLLGDDVADLLGDGQAAGTTALASNPNPASAAAAPAAGADALLGALGELAAPAPAPAAAAAAPAPAVGGLFAGMALAPAPARRGPAAGLLDVGASPAFSAPAAPASADPFAGFHGSALGAGGGALPASAATADMFGGMALGGGGGGNPSVLTAGATPHAASVRQCSRRYQLRLIYEKQQSARCLHCFWPGGPCAGQGCCALVNCAAVPRRPTCSAAPAMTSTAGCACAGGRAGSHARQPVGGRPCGGANGRRRRRRPRRRARNARLGRRCGCGACCVG
jgi:hypothetical protein